MLPLECEALTRGAAAQPSGSKLPRHVSHGPGIFVGKIRELRRGCAYFAFRRVFALLPLSFDGYSPDVAANQRSGLETRESRNRTPHKCRGSFTPVNLCFLAAVRGTPLGVPVSLTPGFQPAHSCHPFAWNESGSSRRQGARQCTATRFSIIHSTLCRTASSSTEAGHERKY